MAISSSKNSLLKQKLKTVEGYITTKNVRRALFTMKWSSCGQTTSTSTPFCDSSSLSLSLSQPAEDTLSSVATSHWEHPVWSLAVARYIKTNHHWFRIFSDQFTDHALLIFVVNHLVREQHVMRWVLKHWNQIKFTRTEEREERWGLQSVDRVGVSLQHRPMAVWLRRSYV